MTAREREREIETRLKRWRKLQREASIMRYEESHLLVNINELSEEEWNRRQNVKDWVDCITYAMKWLKETQPEIHSLLYGHYRMTMEDGYTKAGAASFKKSYMKVHHIEKSQYARHIYAGLSEVAYIATEFGLLKHK